jgi:hypothetical protein
MLVSQGIQVFILKNTVIGCPDGRRSPCSLGPKNIYRLLVNVHYS